MLVDKQEYAWSNDTFMDMWCLATCVVSLGNGGGRLGAWLRPEAQLSSY